MEFDKLASRYLGQTARRYDAERDRTPKWDREQAELDAIFGRLPHGSTAVDIPVGTGRCLELYAKHGLRVTGLDISPDMLAESRAKADSLGLAIELASGDIRKIDAKDGAFDTSICIRFLNWIEIPGVEAAMAELVRVARTDLVLAIRHYVPLSELTPSVTSAKRVVRQLAKRVRKRIEKPGLVIHEKTSVLAVFKKFRLEVLTAGCIQNRGDGTDYYIYHLRKRA